MREDNDRESRIANLEAGIANDRATIRPQGRMARPLAYRVHSTPTRDWRFATSRLLKTYFRLSRAHRYSVLFALPLLIVYESLAAMLNVRGVDVRNGADVILKTPFVLLFGPRGQVVFGVVLVLGAVAVVWRDMRRPGSTLERRVFGLMAAESVVLALAFGLVVGVVTARLLHAIGMLGVALPTDWPLLAVPPRSAARHGVEALAKPTQLMIGIGAGLYEELLFRVIAVGSIQWVARSAFGWGPRAAGTLAVVAGALIFSAFHYVGALGDAFTVQSFAFRAIAGLFLSALYVLRGFGITAWTHSLYDVFLMLFGI